MTSTPTSAVQHVTEPDTLPYLHGLCAMRPYVSALRLRALLTAGGSPAAAWHAPPAMLTAAGFTSEASEAFRQHRERWNLEAEATLLRSKDIQLVPETSASYPDLLRHTYDPPLGLYVRGRLENTHVGVAVVGSRKASPYGRTATHIIARPLAARGITIISGLAYGIDAEAHRAALHVHGRTVAILGSGVDEVSLYPRAHRDLARDIVAGGGMIASEFPPGTEPRAEHFPQRNRIIAGMARAVVVVEATTESGALITARLALAENRDVLVVPGPITAPTSEGTNRLLKEGAAPACSADDIVEALALEEVLPVPKFKTSMPSDASGPAPLAEDLVRAPTGETAVLQTLAREPMTIDEIVAVTTLPAHEVSSVLSFLELDGRVRDVGSKNYVRL